MPQSAARTLHAAASLWRNRPYMALLTGETVAAIGVEIAQVALPIIAVTYLVATEFQIGVLGHGRGARVPVPLAAGRRVGGQGVPPARHDRRQRGARGSRWRWCPFCGSATCSTCRNSWRSRWCSPEAPCSSTWRTCRSFRPRDTRPAQRRQLATADHRGNGPCGRARPGRRARQALSAPWLPLTATFGYLVSAIAIWRIPADEPPPRPTIALLHEIREGVTFVFSNHTSGRWCSRPRCPIFRDHRLHDVPRAAVAAPGLGPAAFGLMLTVTFARRHRRARSAPVVCAALRRRPLDPRDVLVCRACRCF